jgi:uncharacterized coiled-coil DUF342 family protein
MTDLETIQHAKQTKQSVAEFLGNAAAVLSAIDNFKTRTAEQLAAEVPQIKEQWADLCTQAANIFQAEYFELAEKVIEISIRTAQESARIDTLKNEIKDL